MERRNFLKRSSIVSIGLMAVGAQLNAIAQTLSNQTYTLEGSVIDFSKIEIENSTSALKDNKTIVALIETILPGKLSDPENENGAIEAGAIDLLEENHFNIKKYIPYLVFGLNSSSKIKFGKKFHKLTAEQRELVLRKMELDLPFISLFIRYIKIPFFGGDYNNVGLVYMNYPGANDGYHHDETRSFFEPIGTELTTEGYMP